MPITIQTLRCGEIQENAYLVRAEGRGDCAIVDPGDDAAMLKRAIGARALSAVLLTHGHFDHIMAARPLAEAFGCPIYIHPEDLELLNAPGLNGLSSLMGIDAMPGPAIEALAYGEALSAAGLDFEIIHTPGHTKGSACLYLPSEGVLFSGDTLFKAGFGRMDLYGGSPKRMRESLRTLFRLPPDTRVYPGHGEATTIGEERSRYLL